jgi:threonine/homoserine/homoserine lactone efflux protein
MHERPGSGASPANASARPHAILRLAGAAYLSLLGVRALVARPPARGATATAVPPPDPVERA